MLRRILTAVLLAAAVYAVTTVLAPTPPDPGPLVVVAASDLAVGEEITAEMVRTVRMPASLVPDGALSDPEPAHGSVTTAPLRAGEVLTDLRISPHGPLEGLDPELVLAHLPLTDPHLSAILQPGTRVDALATVDGAVLADDILVVQRVPGDDATGARQSFLVAVTPSQAARLAAAAGADLPGQGLTVVIRR